MRQTRPYNAMKADGRTEINLHTFLNSTVQKCGPTLALGRFTPGEKPQYAPKRRLGRHVGKREIYCP
jgi:hypothetical protein